MMTFKFYDQKVTFVKGKLRSDDKVTQKLLRTLVKCPHGGPEHGDPLLNIITDIFGKASIAEVVHDDDDNNIY